MARPTISSLLATVVVTAAVSSCGSTQDIAEESRDLGTQVVDLSQRLSELDSDLSTVESRLSSLDSDTSQQAQSIDDLASRLESQEDAVPPQSLVALATEISSLRVLYTELSRSLSAIPRDKWLAQRLELTQASTSRLADSLAGEEIIERAISESGLPLNDDFVTKDLKVALDEAVSSLQVIRDDLQDGLRFERSSPATALGACATATQNNAELCTYLSIESISETLEGQPISESAEILVVLNAHSLLTKVSLAFDALLS